MEVFNKKKSFGNFVKPTLKAVRRLLYIYGTLKWKKLRIILKLKHFVQPTFKAVKCLFLYNGTLKWKNWQHF